MEESTLRGIIRQVMSENFGPLDEMQKGSQLNTYIDLELSKLTPEVLGDKLDDINVMAEINRQLKFKLNQIFFKNFEYPNFYIIKLGSFVIKTNKGPERIAFKKEGVENKLYSYPYLYVYHDKAEALKFGSRFFESDNIIFDDAQQFIKNNKINLTTKTEPGKKFIITDFDTDNVIDLVDYSKISRTDTPTKTITPVKKNAYIVGRPYNSDKYGRGIIKKTKKFGVDEVGNSIFNVTVDFPNRMLPGTEISKTFRLSMKEKGAANAVS